MLTLNMFAFPVVEFNFNINFKLKSMAKKEKKDFVEQKEVKFLTSIALAVNDVDDVLRHVQLTIIQEIDSKDIRAFMDVVDPSKIKLKDVPDGIK